MRLARLSRASHGLAHACVCAAVLFSWTLPGGLWERAGAPVADAISEDELDAVLQRAATSALGGREGTILVMDAQTGRLRAVVNSPLAFESATPPGSTIKPFTMFTALRLDALGDGLHRRCPGRYEHGDFKIACAHPRHKTPFGPQQALANSCNHYFGRLAETIDGHHFELTLGAFGFGNRTRGGGEREAAGSHPRGEPQVADMLGESEQLLVTPAQLVTAYAALFNGGHRFVPRRAPARGFEPEEFMPVVVPASYRRMMFAGMRGAVSYGTASAAGLATLPLQVFGKTGTSTPSEHWRAQGWFVGLAAEGGKGKGVTPSPNQVRLAVLVLLKRASGADAAQVSRPVFEAYADALARPRGRQSASQTEGAERDDQTARLSSTTGGPSVRVRVAREDETMALPLEDYIFGVLAAEGSVEMEPEALKALAVAARTYALRNLRRHARDGYDLCDNTHCQRFMPVGDESARPDFYELARRAVRETAGEVLRDSSGRVAESYFSASCGGSTADLSKLWGVARAPAHLRGVRDESCATEARAWTDAIPADRLLEALRADERSDVGARLDSVRVVRRDASGRAEFVLVEGERRRLLRGWDFKIIVGRTLGWNVLKSSRFEVARAGRGFVFRGRGFGHGLGLCQTGAHALASRGASYRRILEKYFPGAGTGVRKSDALIDDERRAEVRASSELVGAGLVPARFVAEESGQGQALPLQNYSRPEMLSVALSSRQVLSGQNFRVSFPARASRREAEAALRELEAARSNVLRRLRRAALGAGAPADVELFVHETTGDFVGATGQPAWVAASTAGRRIDVQPLEVLRRRGVLASTLRHEFVHAVCEALSRGRAPRWLVEGLAAHVAGEGAQLARAAAKERIPLEEVERQLERPASAQQMRELYAAAYREVLALIRREGEAGAWRRVARG